MITLYEIDDYIIWDRWAVCIIATFALYEIYIMGAHKYSTTLSTIAMFLHTPCAQLSLFLSLFLSLSLARAHTHTHTPSLSRSLSLCSPLAPTLPVSVSRSHFLTHTQTCNMEAGGSERARPIFFLPVRECIYGCHVFRWYWLKSMWTIVWNEIKLNDSIE